MPPLSGKSNLFGLDRAALGEIVAGLGEPAYRARADLPLALPAPRPRHRGDDGPHQGHRASALAAAYDLRWPDVVERGPVQDGTVKYLFRLDDGATIESVYIPEERRRTICISTQAGCPSKCAFCLTGIAATSAT